MPDIHALPPAAAPAVPGVHALPQGPVRPPNVAPAQPVQFDPQRPAPLSNDEWFRQTYGREYPGTVEEFDAWHSQQFGRPSDSPNLGLLRQREDPEGNQELAAFEGQRRDRARQQAGLPALKDATFETVQPGLTVPRALRSVGQAAFGMGDEFVAEINAFLARLRGDDPEAAYLQSYEHENREIEQFHTVSPGLAKGLDVATTLGTMLLPGRWIAGAPTFFGKVGRGAAAGSVTSAGYGFGLTEGTPGERWQAAFNMSKWGAVAGVAVPFLAPAAARLAQALRQPAKFATRDAVEEVAETAMRRDLGVSQGGALATAGQAYAAPAVRAGQTYVATPITRAATVRSDFEARAGALYQRADDSGIVVSGNIFETAAERMRIQLADASYTRGNFPKADALVDLLEGIEGRPLTLSQAENVRQFISRGIRSTRDENELQIMIAARNSHDEFLNSLTSQDLASQGRIAIDEARQILVDARANWAIARKIELVEEAEIRAGFTGNPQNALRNNLLSIVRNPRTRGAFSPEEQQAILEAANGGTFASITRALSALQPRGLGVLLPASAVAATESVLPLAAPAIGLAGKAFAGSATRRRFDSLIDNLITGNRTGPTIPYDVTRRQVQSLLGAGALTATPQLAPGSPYAR